MVARLRDELHLDSTLRIRIADADDCVYRILYFDLDRCVDPGGLRVAAEITQVRRCGNSDIVALGAGREVNDGSAPTALVVMPVSLWWPPSC